MTDYEDFSSVTAADALPLMQQMESMPELQLLLKMQTFGLSLFIFNRNYEDLTSLLMLLADFDKSRKLYHLRNRDQMQLVMKEILRLLHNFVASAQSLIDHTRNFYKEMYGEGAAYEGLFTDYGKKKDDTFAKDPLSRFVVKLRNYCQHYQTPPISWVLSQETGNSKPQVQYNLVRDALKEFRDWGREAREYLNSLDDDIAILPLVTEYKEKVASFYKWFQDRLQEIHREEIERFSNYERRLLLATFLGNLNMAFANEAAGFPYHKEDVFAGILSSQEIMELDKIASPNDRAEFAISLLESGYFPLTDLVKARIHELYNLRTSRSS